MEMRAAKEFQDGMVVNLGVGIPTLCSNFIPAGREVIFHSENGIIGFGAIVTDPDEADENLINAGVQPVRPRPGMAIVDHAESFVIIRGGQDLAFCAKKVMAVMTHTTREGQQKIVKDLTSPITAPACVDLIVTDIAVIEVTPEGLVLREVTPAWTADEVQALTEPQLIISPDLKEVELL